MFFLLGLFTTAYAQKEKEIGKLYLSGKVVNEKKRGMLSKVLLYQGEEKIKEIETTKIGKFNLNVPLNDTFALIVLVDGYISKTVYVNTTVSERKKHEDFLFPFFIDLYPVGRTPAHPDLDRPVGKIIFSGTQFIYDIAFTKEANSALKEFSKERRNLKVRNLEED